MPEFSRILQTFSFLFSVAVLILSCHYDTKPGDDAKADSVSKTTVINSAANVPQIRDTISREPVAAYVVKTDNPLNDWYFRVRLYETTRTFHYLMKLEFETINGVDTLKLPNFGLLPRPVIQKGPEKYSCIVGFLDKENKFREYKKVYVQGDKLKVTALKHYAVYTYEKEQSN